MYLDRYVLVNLHFNLPSLTASPALIVDVFTQTGISLCPTFTAKALRGMLEEMKTNPGRFAGKRVLFLLTGIQIPSHCIK